jgi:hypothetical protein
MNRANRLIAIRTLSAPSSTRQIAARPGDLPEQIKQFRYGSRRRDLPVRRRKVTVRWTSVQDEEAEYVETCA